MKTNEEIKTIIKKFKSKNGINLIAYRGIWHGANGDKKIKYIEVEKSREFIDSFIESESERKYSVDKLLKNVVKELENTYILKNFEIFDFRGKGYKFCGKGSVKEIIEELKLLISTNERIEFNEDFGVGKLHYENGKYLIELNVYCNMSFPVATKNIKVIAKWLKDFHLGKSGCGEAWNELRAMSCAFMKDAENEKDTKKIIKRMEREIKDKLESIK